MLFCSVMPVLAAFRSVLYEKYIDVNLKVLRRKGKSRGKKETRGKFNLGKTIRKRDKSVYKRQEFGHWEADTVVSGSGKSKVCFATLGRKELTKILMDFYVNFTRKVETYQE